MLYKTHMKKEVEALRRDWPVDADDDQNAAIVAQHSRLHLRAIPRLTQSSSEYRRPTTKDPALPFRPS
jgi:hypothetical protein